MPESKHTPPTCSTCRFANIAYTDGNDQARGVTCRAHPPVVVVTGGHGDYNTDAPITVWPDVFGSDWCGEHQPVPGGAE
jgi:hypothetical protein